MYLVCSPDGQLEQLVDYLHNNQIEAYPLAIMGFIVDSENLQILANKINNFDYVVFTSPSSIKFSADIIKKAIHPIFLTVGKSSAKKLELLTKLPVIYPVEGTGAISLYEEKLKSIDFKNKKILIVKGVGGNQILIKKLSLIDANWEELNIYIRREIPINMSFIKKSLTTKGFHGIIITSSILVEWLFTSAKKYKYFDILVQQPFFTLHNNIAQKLREYGVLKVFISKEANQYSLVNLVKEFVNE